MSGGDEIEKENQSSVEEIKEIVDNCIHIHYHYHHHYHPSPESGQAPPPPSASSRPLPPSPAYKIFCRANEKYNLTIRNDTVVLAPANENDKSQHWMRYSTEIKDENGSSAFSLVNKHTGQAIKHSFGHDHPVRLLQYNPDYLDESMLWTEAKDMGDGFRGIRMVNNINLHFDAIRGDKHHEGVHDGTGLILFKWWDGENFNQQWKIIPWCKH